MMEKDILRLIEHDPWMMNVLRVAETQHFLDWVIGAGFVRNKVWDFLHGYAKNGVETNDIDLVYYDPDGNDQKTDEALSQKLRDETGIKWEIVNETYAHVWNGIPPYRSTEDALAHWPETATGVGVTLKGDQLKLIAPYGIDDLVHLVIRPSPKFSGGMERVVERARAKQWLTKWPRLKFQL